MDSIVLDAVSKIAELEASTPAGKHIVTADIRRLSARLYGRIENPSFDKVARICDELLEQHSWALGVVAFEFEYRGAKSLHRPRVYIRSLLQVA